MQCKESGVVFPTGKKEGAIPLFLPEKRHEPDGGRRRDAPLTPLDRLVIGNDERLLL